MQFIILTLAQSRRAMPVNLNHVVLISPPGARHLFSDRPTTEFLDLVEEYCIVQTITADLIVRETVEEILAKIAAAG